MLQCTVRNCRSPLVRRERQVVCEHRHSFDVAKSGYVNVLQPQDKRSKNPGDTAAAVAARRRTHDRGVTAPLLDGIAALLHASADDVVLDAGCGDGFYLGSLAARTGLDPHGIDISIPAIDAAAKRYQGYEWVVANADRVVPYSDGAFSAVLSITGRMNSREFHRVLKPGGRLLVALAAPEDLIELRGTGRDRVERTLTDFADGFRLVEQRRVTTYAEMDTAGIEDILQSIYRPLQSGPAKAGRVTFCLDLLLLYRD